MFDNKSFPKKNNQLNGVSVSKVVLLCGATFMFDFTGSLSNNTPITNIAVQEKTACERHRERAQSAASSSSGSGLFSFFRPRPAVGHYVPQCDQHGAYESTQCHTSIGQCWCVDAEGQEVPNTRTGPGNVPLCESRDSSYLTLLLLSPLLHPPHSDTELCSSILQVLTRR